MSSSYNNALFTTPHIDTSLSTNGRLKRETNATSVEQTLPAMYSDLPLTSPTAAVVSTTAVETRKLPLRKRPAKDQKSPLQWLDPIGTRPLAYPQYDLVVSNNNDNSNSNNNSSSDSNHNDSSNSTDSSSSNRSSSEHKSSLSYITIPSQPSPSTMRQELPPIQYTHNHTDATPLPPTKSLLSDPIPSKLTTSNKQTMLKKKLANIDENDRPVKKTKRGRPPLSSNSAKPLATANKNKTNQNGNIKGGANSESVITLTAHSDTNSNSSKPVKDTLYCICRRPYNNSQFMIACDQCNQWFHGECIDINEKQSEFVDLYFCTNCSKSSGKHTSWKAKCSNPDCEKAARTGKNQQSGLSKYCGDKCGMQLARARLAMADKKQQLINGSKGEDELTTFTSRMEQLSKTRLSLFADRDDRQRLARIRAEKRRACDIIHRVNLKEHFLQALLSSLESSSDTCGFDSRLLWDEDQWDNVTDIEKEPTLRLLTNDHAQQDFTICNQKSKRCQRHNGWSKLKSAELEQEREEQFVVLSILARERKLIKTRISNRLSEINVAKSLMNGTLLHLQ